MNIVIALNGTEGAENILRWAREVSRSVSSPTFHVVHSLQQGLPGTLVAGPGMRIIQHLRRAPAADAVLEIARTCRAGLIILSSQSLGGSGRGVLYRAPVPVLVVKEGEARSVRRVLTAVDGSALSQRALQFALSWFPQAELVAMNVATAKLLAGVFYKDGAMPLDVDLHHAQDTVHWAIAAAGLNPEDFTVKAAAGGPVEELVEEARFGSYDVVVLGNRGLGRLGELLLGSVSEGVLRQAMCPVVVVK